MSESISCCQDVGPAAGEPDTRDARERAHIIRAAHRLIGSNVGSTTPIEDILREAKVNRRTFYRHFPSKEELVLAMQREGGALVRNALAAAVEGAADGRRAVIAWIEEFLAIGWQERRAREGRTFLAPEVGLVDGIADALEDIYACHRRILAETLTRACADGSLPDALPERDAFAIHAVVLRCLEMRVRGRLRRPYREIRDEVVGVFVTSPAQTPHTTR